MDDVRCWKVLLASPTCVRGFFLAAQEYDSAVVVRVKDGDTFVARIGQREETIRLIGVDAPESYFNGKNDFLM